MSARHDDLLEQARWWLDESIRCMARGACGLAVVCANKSLALREKADTQ